MVGSDLAASRPCRFATGREPRVPTGQEVGWAPVPVSNTWRREKAYPPGLELRSLGSRTRTWSLYRFLII
jgi:hypothetical protein